MFHQLLTAPQVIAQPSIAVRYKVELASNEVELDRDGNAVPKYFKTIDLVVAEPTEEAIKTLIAAADWLTNYTMVSYWKPCDGTEF